MKRTIIIVLVTVCVCAGLLIGFIGLPEVTPGASYQGRSAEQWLGDIWAPSQNQYAAIQAFQEMGTNAFPLLFRMLRKRDTPLDAIYQRWYPKIPARIQKHLARPLPESMRLGAVQLVAFNSGSHRQEFFLYLLEEANRDIAGSPDGYGILIGNLAWRNDTNAIPVLLQSLQRTNFMSRVSAAEGLGRIGSAADSAVPTLTTLLKDSNVTVRVSAAEAIWSINKTTNGVMAVLRATMNDPAAPSWTRQQAAISLNMADTSDTSLIPIFISWLNGSDPVGRPFAIQALRRYGSAAREAVPALTRIIESGDRDDTRYNALMALREIDPEAAAKYEGR